MSRLISRIVLSVLICSMLGAASTRAEWIENGTAICTAVQDQGGSVIAYDGSGGAIIAWQDFRNADWDIYTQRIDASGYVLWSNDGLPISTLPGPQQFPKIISDPQGGAIIIFIADPDTNTSIYAQKIDDNGSIVWPSGGILICETADTLLSAQLVTDKAGGAIVTWQDSRSGNLDIYAQRIDAGGAVQWTANGVVMCDDLRGQFAPHIAPDDSGGAIIAWTDLRSASDADIYAQRIDASGTARWPANGIPVCESTDDQENPVLAADGAGGAIIAWMDSRSTDTDIYAQRINKTGGTHWTADGVAVCTELGDQECQRIIAEGIGGAIISWVDRFSEGDIFIQKIDPNGHTMWVPSNGVPVCLTTGEQSEVELVSNGNGGAVVTWKDGRYAPDFNIFIQIIDSYGLASLTMNGSPVCTTVDMQYEPQLVPDGIGGAIITWTDHRDDSADIYSQRIERYGYWGYPAPEIIDARDVPGDQGGFVSLAWNASRLDPWPHQFIQYYSVWRAINTTQATAMLDNGAMIIHDISDIDMDTDVPIIRMERFAGDTFYWKFINYIFSAYLETYSETVRTLFDSTAVCSENHYFQVIAHASELQITWVSPPDSGYSVDNLSPAAPIGMSGQQRGDDLEITWNANDENDLSHYSLYRGLTEDFIPEDAIGILTDTVAIDTLWSPDENHYYYKLIAFDIHGNASNPTTLFPSAIVATLLQGFSASVADGGIRITWRLAECDDGIAFKISRAEAKLMEFVDLTQSGIERDGLSFTYIDTSWEPGKVYCYRVEASGDSGWEVLFETEQIATPGLPLTLFQNHPNPFNPSTMIRYYLPEAALVLLDIYDVSGRRIKRLIEKRLPVGYHEINWNGQDALGNDVSSGIYFYTLTAGKRRSTKKMILMR